MRTDYPISLGADHTAATLISPDPDGGVHAGPSIWAAKENAPRPEPRLLGGKNGAPPPRAESGYVIALKNQAEALITAPQSDRMSKSVQQSRGSILDPGF